MDTKFTHLHLHTEYSLLDGFCGISKLISKVKDLGMTSVAITDHGSMFGVIDFYRECLAQDIKPILGCEIYMSQRGMHQKDAKHDWENYHLVLLAENNIGYSNLMKIVSLGYIEGFYRKPRVDYDVLREYSEGIIALTGCIAGKVPAKCIRDDIDGAREDLLTLKDIFGKDHLFIEIQDHGLADEKKANEYLLKFAKEEDLGLVATNDAHYINKDEAQYHDVLLCVQTASTYDDPKRMRFPNDEFYIKSHDEMSDLFSYVPEAIENTVKIAERCHVDIEFEKTYLPRYDLPENKDAKSFLQELCLEGLYRKYPQITDELTERLDHELSVIDQMGFNDYFLIVWDFIKYAKDNGIAVGPGRGSAAGSIVSYCLDITEIDPIRYNLIFERFLNSERISMPDIDIDFCYENRSRVIQYVVEKYKASNVAQIITFGTLGAKAAIRDVGRSIGMSYSDCDKVAKLIPSRLNTTIDSAIDENIELRTLIETDEDVARLIDISRALEGTPRHASTHAAGVVITDRPVVDYVPLYVNDGNIATQFPMNTINDLGLLKMDFLGLRNLTVIKDTVENIKRAHGVEVDINHLKFDDPNVYALISRGDTLGVFQLESSGMRVFMQNLQPDSFEDIIAGISLYRPGPMQYIDLYIKNKKKPEEIKYLHHTLEPVLNVTYGCMIYQEQVMQIVRDLAGYSMGQSDSVRRAMSKKKAKEMEAGREAFVKGNKEKNIKGCVSNGIDEKVANEIYDQMIDFASYAFNKSHAAAYAVISYQTAYLKAYYPVEFMAALLTSVIGFDDKINKYIHHLRDMDIDLLAPDVNDSFERFTAVEGKIRFGLLAVKGLGESAVNEIIQTREEKGRFVDFPDFVKKMDFHSLNKRGVENLIKSGAFDSLGHKRSQLMLIASDFIDSILRQRKQNIDGQMNLMDMINDNVSETELIMPKNMKELEIDELLQFEKDALGLYISGHPLSKYEAVLKRFITHDSISLNVSEEDEPLNDGDQAVVGGIITGIKAIVTKNNRPMAFVQVEDLYGTFEIVVFSKLYEEKIYLLKKDVPILIKGKISKKDEGAVSIAASSIYDLTDRRSWSRLKPIKNKEDSNVKSKRKPTNSADNHLAQSTEEPITDNIPQSIPSDASIIIALDQHTIILLDQLKKIMLKNTGNTRVVLYDKDKNKKYLADKSLWVTEELHILKKLRDVIGHENVKVVRDKVDVNRI